MTTNTNLRESRKEMAEQRKAAKATARNAPAQAPAKKPAATAASTPGPAPRLTAEVLRAASLASQLAAGGTRDSASREETHIGDGQAVPV